MLHTDRERPGRRREVGGAAHIKQRRRIGVHQPVGSQGIAGACVHDKGRMGQGPGHRARHNKQLSLRAVDSRTVCRGMGKDKQRTQQRDNIRAVYQRQQGLDRPRGHSLLHERRPWRCSRLRRHHGDQGICRGNGGRPGRRTQQCAAQAGRRPRHLCRQI